LLDPSYGDLGQVRPPTLKVRTKRSPMDTGRPIVLSMVSTKQ
jgi:hypothetical protein